MSLGRSIVIYDPEPCRSFVRNHMASCTSTASQPEKPGWTTYLESFLMHQVDWSYHRNGCKTCAKASCFLTDHDVEIAEQEDARKTALVESDALRLVSDANELYVTRGTKVVHINLKTERPDDETLLGLLMGPSGKLRAPTIKIGKTVIVGFDQTTYENVFRVAAS